MCETKRLLEQRLYESKEEHIRKDQLKEIVYLSASTLCSNSRPKVSYKPSAKVNSLLTHDPIDQHLATQQKWLTVTDLPGHRAEKISSGKVSHHLHASLALACSLLSVNLGQSLAETVAMHQVLS